jgi:hypothetical protein
MTSGEMGQVTGKEGLAIDLDLNASAGKYFVDDGNGDKLLFQGITLDNGSGGQASLTGLTVDADGSDGLVFGAPSGTFRADANIFCTEDFSTPGCDGSLSGGDEAYGRLEARGINLGNSSINPSGRGDGLSVPTVSSDLLIDEIRYYDRNGEAQDQNAGSAGVLELSNFQLRNRGGPAEDFDNGIELDVDNTDGIVATIPSEQNPEPDGSEGNGNARPASVGMDLQVNDVRVGDPSSNPPGNSFGQFWIENFSMTGFNGNQSRIQVQPNGNGLTIDGRIFFNAHRIAWQNENANATAQLGATYGAGEFRLHNGSNNPVNFSDLSIGFDDPDGVVIDMTPTQFTVDIPHTDLGNGGPGVGVFFEDMRFGFQSSGENVWKFGGHGEGITADLDLEFDIYDLDLVDNDGTPSNGSAGTVRFGAGGTEIELGSVSNETDPAPLTGLTIDADPNRGLVLGLPDGNFQLQLNDLAVGQRGGSFGASMGSIHIEDLNFLNSSEIALRGTGNGLEVDALFNGSPADVAIIDEDGWSGGSSPSGGRIFAKNALLTLDDGGGNPATLTVDLDSTRGMVVGATDATVSFETDTIFLGKDQGGSPSPIDGNLRMNGSQIDVFTR